MSEKHPGDTRQKAEAKSKSFGQITQQPLGRDESLPLGQEIAISNEIKQMAYQRLLTQARCHLSPYSRVMSNIFHQPIIDTLSEAVSKTIGRPSGILGGGVVALLGTSAYYYITRHYGYSYNDFVFLLLLVLGFILGWVIELLCILIKIFGKK